MNPTDQAIAGTHRIAHQMGARFSAPAERVEAECEMSTMKFSRTLDERHPYMRSSQVTFVENDPPMHPGDFWVSVVGVICIVLAVGWLL